MSDDDDLSYRLDEAAAEGDFSTFEELLSTIDVDEITKSAIKGGNNDILNLIMDYRHT